MSLPCCRGMHIISAIANEDVMRLQPIECSPQGYLNSRCFRVVCPFSPNLTTDAIVILVKPFPQTEGVKRMVGMLEGRVKSNKKL